VPNFVKRSCFGEKSLLFSDLQGVSLLRQYFPNGTHLSDYLRPYTSPPGVIELAARCSASKPEMINLARDGGTN
jgi:hypothetical protein